jgi:hypothetical protein
VAVAFGPCNRRDKRGKKRAPAGEMGNRQRSPASPRQLALLAVVTTLVIIAVAIRAGGDIRNAARGLVLLHDDAYYYTVVARNFATTGEMTFDGISRTNGYHPLWFWIQVAMFKAGGSDLSVKGQALAVMVLQWSILAATFAAWLAWVYRNWRLRTAAGALVAVVLLAYTRHLSVFALGMESTLLLPLIPLLLLLVWRDRLKAAGLVALLLVMARLDTLVYIVFPVSLYVAFRGRPSLRNVIARGLSIGGPPLAGVLVLMGIYQSTFGHPMPIHGVLRSTFPIPNLQPHLFTEPVLLASQMRDPARLAMFGLPVSVIILPLCGFSLLWHGFLRQQERRGVLLVVLLGLVQLGAYLCFQKWTKPVSGWYLAPLLVFVSGAVGGTVVNLMGRRRTLTVSIVLALGIAGLSGLREYRRFDKPAVPGALDDFVSSQAPGAVWAATDCGSVSFWTGATFIDLDGLINSFDYQAALRDHDLAGYLRRAGTDYLVVGAWESEPSTGPTEPMYVHRVDPHLFRGDYATYDFFVYSYMYECYSDTITLLRDQEVWRSAPGMDGTIPSRTVIFALGVEASSIPIRQ